MTYQTDGAAVGFNGSAWVVSTSLSENRTTYFGTALYEITDLGNGYVALDNVNQGGTGDVKTGAVSIQLDSGAGFRINSTTQFLVRTTAADGSYVYTPYTGMNSVPTVTDASVIDYELGTDGYADHVYIVGTPVFANTNTLVYVKDKTDWYYDNNRINYYLRDAYVAGARPRFMWTALFGVTLPARTVPDDLRRQRQGYRCDPDECQQ